MQETELWTPHDQWRLQDWLRLSASKGGQCEGVLYNGSGQTKASEPRGGNGVTHSFA